MSDRELVRRCIDGETGAWNTLVRRHLDLLYALVAKILRPQLQFEAEPEIEDVLQAVFTKLWADDRRRLRAFEGRARLSTWLVVIARREALDRLRGRGIRERSKADYDIVMAAAVSSEDDVDPVHASERAEEQAAVGAALAQLPPRDRLLLQLIYGEDCAYAEVARLLDVAENSIGPMLQRARKRLRTVLEKETT